MEPIDSRSWEEGCRRKGVTTARHPGRRLCSDRCRVDSTLLGGFQLGVGDVPAVAELELQV